MNKYAKLGEHLKAQIADEVPMTFAEIERIIGAKLPPKSQHSRAWWSNNPENNVMTKVWRDASFVSERVDMEGRKVVFKRVSYPNQEGKSMNKHTMPGAAEEGRTFKPSEADAEKKPYRHPLFGAMKGTFTLIPPSDDEPPPEDPDSWEALALAKFDRLLFGKGE